MGQERNFGGGSLCVERRIPAAAGGEKKALWSANERIAALVKTKELIGGARNADADGFSDWSRGMAGLAQPEGARRAQVEAVVAAIDLKSGGEASRAGCEIEKLTGLAMPLHKFDTLKRLECADEDGCGDAGRLADDIEHEVRAIVEKNVGMARIKIHRTNARRGTTEMMSGGVARRISFRFHDAAAKAASGKIVDDDFSDEEAGQLDSVRWKFGAAQALDCEFRGGGLQRVAIRGHGMLSQRDGFCKSS
jgi:hypothetical protein